MNRHELARVLLDEIVRMRAQLIRLRMVLARRAEERISRMSQCEECERLWKAYQTATIESVQLYKELKSITEDQGLEKLSGTRTRKLPSSYEWRLVKGWQNIKQQPAIVDMSCAFGNFA